MSYCMFENTYYGLADCYQNLDNNDLSENEKYFRDEIIELCRNIIESVDEQ